MIPLDLKELEKYLKDKKIDVKEQTETNQLYILSKAHNQEYPTFLRIMDGGGLLQILAFMPIHLEPKTVNDVARLLHLFNKEIDVPGFGMDETAKVCFYRIITPAIDGKVDGPTIERYIKSISNITDTFYPVVAAVVTGMATFDDVLKKASTNIKP